MEGALSRRRPRTTSYGHYQLADNQSPAEAETQRTDQANADLLPARPLQGRPAATRQPSARQPRKQGVELLTGIPSLAAIVPQR